MKGCMPLDQDDATRALEHGFTGRYAARDRALCALGLKSGFRVSELLSLRVRDVIRNGQFVQQVNVRRQNMKGKHTGRRLPLASTCHPFLTEWIGQLATLNSGGLDPDQFLFASRKGENKPISRYTATRIVQRALAAIGIEGPAYTVGFHSLRKTFAEQVYERTGRDLLTTQKIMGHKSVDSTAKYIAVNEEEVRSIIESL